MYGIPSMKIEKQVGFYFHFQMFSFKPRNNRLLSVPAVA